MRVDTYRDANGEWRWRLIATNGRITAESGEGYKTRANLVRALVALERVINGSELVRALTIAIVKTREASARPTR